MKTYEKWVNRLFGSNKLLFILCFGLSVATTLLIHSAFQVLGPAIESERFTSLGTPQIVNIDQTLGEQKVILNDPSIQKNWGLMGTKGQSDIRVSNAWAISQGDRNVVVAIIDTGIDINHPDLAENIWQNPGETGLDEYGRDKATNGIDDDHNGYIDDAHGWDFVNNRPTLVDNHGHGTHIAGIVGAVGGNGIGISGVCPRVSMMILKYYDPNSKNNDNLKNTVRAIKYAVNNGAHIINYSGGGTEPNDEEFAAVQMARDKGILFVAAAGNERSNSDVSPYYPADYSLSNIISVTAIDSYAKVLRSSNYGQRSVHVAAPGEGIFSTLPNSKYGLMTGTSQATAFVTGVAALILANNKEMNTTLVKKQILGTVDEIPGLKDKTKTGGKLNSYAALAVLTGLPANGTAPVRITGLAAAVGVKDTSSGSSDNVDQPSLNSAASVFNRIIRAAKTPPKNNGESEQRNPIAVN